MPPTPTAINNPDAYGNYLGEIDPDLYKEKPDRVVHYDEDDTFLKPDNNLSHIDYDRLNPYALMVDLKKKTKMKQHELTHDIDFKDNPFKLSYDTKLRSLVLFSRKSKTLFRFVKDHTGFIQRYSKMKEIKFSKAYLPLNSLRRCFD